MSERWTYDTSISTIRNEEGRRIADVYWSPETYMRAVQRGRVMAAGQDLLAIAEDISQWARETGWANDEGGLFDTLDAAIAKARGEA